MLLEEGTYDRFKGNAKAFSYLIERGKQRWYTCRRNIINKILLRILIRWRFMRKYEVQIEEYTDDTNEAKTYNTKDLKHWLQDNKIYFETIVMFCLSFMSIVVTIASVVISYSELSLTNVQTQILVAENAPNIIYSGVSKEIDMNYENYKFENIGGITQELSAYMTDDIIIHVVKDDYMYFIDVHVNGRFNKSKPVSGTSGQTMILQGNNDLFDTSQFVEEIKGELNDIDGCEITFAIAQRVVITYIDPTGTEQRLNYALLNEKLVKDGSFENPYYNCRENEINYDCIMGNKEEVLETITARVQAIMKN